ncbi:hypothetical protein [Azohydromonas sediminis]|uniref:hypothetical protein n=1 Tax=Azohydromonas sediminis TaxID=2259674 RepID=UPI0013C2A0B7|nr:hypothetical protein [Azohydromonas sediminis]
MPAPRGGLAPGAQRCARLRLPGLAAWAGALAAAAPALASAATPFARGLGCVAEQRLECGCALRVEGSACSASPTVHRPALFVALGAGAPLVLQRDGREVVLPPHARNPPLPDAGLPWPNVQHFGGEGLRVRIEFNAAPNTCPKPATETCEYVEVRATVTVVEPGRAPVRLRGRGTCGC